LLLLPRVLFVAVIVISETIRPIYRPLVRWISSLSIIKNFSDFIGSLPRLVILILFVVPFAIAEPLKIVGVVLIARAAVLPGVLIIIGAYLMSFVLVERIFHAGREKLLTYAWLRWIMMRVDTVRSTIAELRAQLMASTRGWLKR
jgi:hypothetical protein